LIVRLIADTARKMILVTTQQEYVQLDVKMVGLDPNVTKVGNIGLSLFTYKYAYK